MKRSELCKYPQFEVVEISVSESHTYCSPQGIIEALHKSIGNSFDEIVEDLVSPVSQCVNELCEVFIACEFSL